MNMPRYVNSETIRAQLAARITTHRKGRPRSGDYPMTTQQALARELGISQGYLSQFLAGGRPRPAIGLLRSLGYDPDPYYRKADDK